METKKIRITKWQHEDEMTEKTMYDALYSLSEVRITRMFPMEIEVLKEPKIPYCNSAHIKSKAKKILDIFRGNGK